MIDFVALPEDGEHGHQGAAEGVGVAADGGDAADDAGCDGNWREEMLGAEHEAVPIVGDAGEK